MESPQPAAPKAPTSATAPRPTLLAKERTVAGPGFNRWLVPPAALAIHLCIGMAYGFSVFWLPLSRAIGVQKSVVCPASAGLWNALFTTTCDWRVSDLGWMYTLFFVLLGGSAATWGGWLERVGPRRAGIASAIGWCGGLLGSAAGVYFHQLWMLWLFSGVIGGIGLGLGYISPVSTLIKWFPDRRGLATGMAIMGFGGGAMIGAPLANQLLGHFASATAVGVWQTFVILAVVYAVFMVGGAFGYRIPPADWQPAGYLPPQQGALRTTHQVHLRDAHKTPQFVFVWIVLCLNVSAGIGVIGMASPMLQEIFAGGLIGHPEVGFLDLSAAQKSAVATIAAGFTGLLSLFNIGGRFFWAALSDRLGRRATYSIFFLLGVALYAAVPLTTHAGNKVLFVAILCIILSMYGGGFATVPAYLADLFGTRFVGAIHGRLLTAWSTAGIFGPLVVNYLREAQIRAGVPRARVYDFTMYTLAGLLVLGLLANLQIKPVAARWHMADAESGPASLATAAAAPDRTYGIGKGGLDLRAALAWLAVGVPLLWGVYRTLLTARVLFR